jgi:deazaflavin-dependent oxidoreductase (nitroreductase family)
MADLMTETPVDPASGWVADHVRLYTQSNGAQGHMWREGVPTLLLTTRGRKSGQARRTALIYAKDGDNYVVMASYGGSPTHPDWYLNIEADPEVVLQVGAARLRARAARDTPESRAHLWGLMTAVWPDYDAYSTKTHREIPVVVLTPHD